MVGEIRDAETAEIALQSAQTGHLVLSTLHTNDSISAITRLLDLNVPAFLVASSVTAVIAQRLVRKLCTNCRKSYAPNTEEAAAIIHLFNLRKDQDFSYIHNLEAAAIKQRIGEGLPAGTSPTTITTLWRASPDGCEECNHTGYRGRIGIYEVLGVSNPVQKLIMNNATSADLQVQAISEGMSTMQTDGLVKAIRGETAIEEVLRVTKE